MKAEQGEGWKKNDYHLTDMTDTRKIPALRPAIASCGLEGPPPVEEFGRYSRATVTIQKSRPRFASRVSLGEIINEESRPPAAITVPADHMRGFYSVKSPSPNSLKDFMSAAAVFNEATVSYEQTKRSTQIRPLTCAGLPIRKYPLTTLPSTGIRRSPSKKERSNRKREWISPLKNVDFEHHRPFESSIFGKESQSYIISDMRSDSMVISATPHPCVDLVYMIWLFI